MQFTFDVNQQNLVAMLLGFTLCVPVAVYAIRRAVIKTKVQMMSRLPMTLEKIDADKELIRAHHGVELCRLELQIAEIKAAEAEANAKSSEALGRIDKLNRRIEVLQLKLAARNVRRDIRKVDEQLIHLDRQETPLEEKTAQITA